ncbi:MAG: lysoplasmalogenase [Rikenellaceae bacterium]|nr:lysoplasmalogenase [Rikenellaceae bacterium]
MFFARNENAGSAENGKRGKMRRDKWLIVAALAFSVAGDWMLGRRGEGTLRFECGVALFFVAHVGFLLFCLHHGRPRWLFLGALLAGYGLFFALRLAPAIPGPTLWGATLLYMLVSCFSLAAAAGLRLPTPCRQLFFAGIACIVFSDTLIACREFLHTGKWMYHYLMAPTYYASHILVAAAVAGRF